MPGEPAFGEAHVTNRPEGDKGDENARKSALVGRAREHFLDLDRNAVAAHHHHALRDREVVDEDLHLVLFRGIEFDDRAAAEPQRLVYRHGGGSEHDGDVERYLVECRHVSEVPVSEQSSSPEGSVPTKSPEYGYPAVNGPVSRPHVAPGARRSRQGLDARSEQIGRHRIMAFEPGPICLADIGPPRLCVAEPG